MSHTRILTNTLLSLAIGARTAFIEMWTHKLRSVLSMLGVMLGVAALVAMLSLIGGIDMFLQEKMGRWAGALFIFHQRDLSDVDKIALSRSPGLRLSDGPYLKENTEEVATLYRSISRRTHAQVGGIRIRRCRLQGTTPQTFAEDLDQVELGIGRLLSEEDYASGARVCVISWEIYDDLKRRLLRSGRDTTDILDMELTAENVRFRIIGTIRPIDPDFKPWHLRHAVIVPLRAMQKHVTGIDPDPGVVRLVVSDPEKIEEQTARVVRALVSRHRGAEDFRYRTADWAEDMTTMLSNVTVVMGIVSIVSLLVGGMGIMNVMLSSISERIKEIGVRKALGAQNIQIFIQFVAETTTLSLTGGTIGALLGLIPLSFGEAIKQSTEGVIMPTVLPGHVLLVVGVIVAVGIVFGLYPAIRASRMNPIDALRYE